MPAFGPALFLCLETAGDVALHVRIPAELDARLQALASAWGLSLAAVVIEALRAEAER